MILFLVFVCTWCSCCQVERVHARPRCCKASSSCRLDSRRQLFKVWWPLYDSIAFGNTCKEFLIPWCVILTKNMTTFTSVLGAPRLSMILTTCLTRTLFLSPSNTGSVVALSISQTPRRTRQMWFQVGDVWLPVHRDQGRTRQLWNAWPGLVSIIKQPMTKKKPGGD